MAQSKIYSSIIIGSGQGAGPLAMALAKAGGRVALIEQIHVGGSCINEGCTPTKTMVASARIAYLSQRSADYGVVADVRKKIDMSVVQKRRKDIVSSFRSGSEGRFKRTEGLDLLMGKARFTGNKQVEVDLNDSEKVNLTAENIFINVGARPSPLKINGVDSVPVLNSTTIMELEVVPDHLLIIGGGYIGLEFGQMFLRFGSKVTIIQRGAHLLTREDDDIADAVADILRQDGIDVLLKTTPTKVAKTANGDVLLTVKGPDGEKDLTGSHLLAAAGRTPNTDLLNLQATNVQLDDHGYIKANDSLQTSSPGIYALGDVKGGPAFTHISYDDFRIIKTNLLDKGTASTLNRQVPYTVFIDPQLGRIGLTESEARKRQLKIRVASMPMTYVARALEVDETRGLMKAIVDAESGQILGCAILGIEGGEMMSAIQVAMMGKLPYQKLRDATFAHPTLAESFNNLFGMLE
jgi:pyruvate/2-oxoglutarate dehydrogenase complex dihydrolipoamide dehydrogenase (E3) component